MVVLENTIGLSMSQLNEKKCVACEGGVSALSPEEILVLKDKLGGNWDVINDHHLEKEYKFSNFQKALDFTNKVGVLAEEEGHHPDIHLAWGRVRLVIWTHSVNALTENDFVLAAKCDLLYA